jgi:hypothetical protein
MNVKERGQIATDNDVHVFEITRSMPRLSQDLKTQLVSSLLNEEVEISDDQIILYNIWFLEGFHKCMITSSEKEFSWEVADLFTLSILAWLQEFRPNGRTMLRDAHYRILLRVLEEIKTRLPHVPGNIALKGRKLFFRSQALMSIGNALYDAIESKATIKSFLKGYKYAIKALDDFIIRIYSSNEIVMVLMD